MSVLLALLLAASPPSITKLPTGDYLVPAAAFVLIDDEMKRLQAVEAQHKGESWVTVVAVSSLSGLLVGALVTGLVAFAVGLKAPSASPAGG